MPMFPTYLESDSNEKSISARSSFECSEFTYSLNQSFNIDAAFTVDDDNCVALILQGITGDEILEISINGNSSNAIDSLIMDSGVYYSYLNEQKYHINPLSGSYLIEKDPSIENLTNNVDFTWSIPSNDDFVLVLDNMRHPADEGRGAGGGISVSISVAITYNNENWLWKPYDSIIQLEPNEFEIFNNQQLSFDEGDEMTIESTHLFGNGNSYLMTEQQYIQYSSNGVISEGSNIEAASLELASGMIPDQLTWTVTSDYANVPLHLVIVNDGPTKMATTLTLLVNPVLNPIIDILSHNSTNIQLEDTLQLDALSTPNKWSQLKEISWNIEGIGLINGPSASAKWDSPGEYNVELIILRSDGEMESENMSISVVDSIMPNLKIVGVGDGAFIEQNSDLIINCECTDNHEIESINWIWDSTIDSNQGSTFVVITTDLGPHNLTVRVTDISGNIGESSLEFTIVDATSPELISVNWPEDNLVQNTLLEFSIKANDPEDSNIVYRWDIDLSTDSNNDGNKRNDWILGAYDTSTNEAVMSYAYSTPGVYTIMVQVVNSENRKLELTHSVAVSQASAPKTSSKIYIGGGAILLGLLGGIGYLAWNNIQRRISQIETEGKNLTPEEQKEIELQKVSQELYGDAGNDLASVASIGTSEQQWSRPQTQQINYPQMTGIPESAPIQEKQYPQSNNIGNDMLDALINEDEKVPKKLEEIDDDLSFLTEMKKSNVADEETKTTKLKEGKIKSGLKMEIPGMNTTTEIPKKVKGGLKIELPPLPEKLETMINEDDDIDI